MGEDDLEPNEDRRFDYSDSFALVGINPFSAAKPIPLVTTATGDKDITGNYIHSGDIILNGVSLTDFISSHNHPAGTPPGDTGTPNTLP